MGNIFASVATQIHERLSLPAVVQCAICARFGAIAAQVNLSPERSQT